MAGGYCEPSGMRKSRGKKIPSPDKVGEGKWTAGPPRQTSMGTRADYWFRNRPMEKESPTPFGVPGMVF